MDALARLKALVREGNDVLYSGYSESERPVEGKYKTDGAAFSAWHSRVRVALRDLFGRDHPYVENFEKAATTQYPRNVVRGIGVLKGAVADLEEGHGPVHVGLPSEVATKLPSRLETLAAEYELGRVLGEGGAGRVYEATSDLGQRVAVKVLTGGSSDKRKRFRNEVGFCETSQHPNIIRVLDTGFVHVGDEKLLFCVMPFFEKTLRKLLAEGPPVETGLRLKLFSQLLDGVEAAHLQKVVHRDLKPENILLDPSGELLVVADFGVAHFEEESLLTAVETKDGQRLANFQYAAPEQKERGAGVGPPADIYALGLILNEMFTGKLAHGTDYRTIESVRPDVAYLDALVSEMMRQDPAARPQTIDDVKRILIGNKAEFVARQKLDEAKAAVVPAVAVSDLLVEKPVAIAGYDYRDGEVWITLNWNLEDLWERGELWIYCFRSYDGGTTTIGAMAPEACIFSQNTVHFPATAADAEAYFELFKQYLTDANRRYEVEVEKRMHEREAAERRKIEESVKREEERHRVLSKLRL